MNPKVSIIFPTFNGLSDTKDCLNSIRKLRYPKEKLEIIVVDNHSSDETVDIIQKEFPEVKVLAQKTNLGFAKAVNLGMKYAKGDYLLITNNDVVFDKNYLTKLVDFLQKESLVGITGGKVYYQKPKGKIAFPGARFNFYTGLLRPSKNPNTPSETDWIPGCNLLVRKEVLEEIGAFDEKFFFYFEDLDLCVRAKRAGYKVVYYPKAIIHHGEGVSIDRQGWQKKSEFYYQGKTRVLFKHATKLQLLSSLLFQFIIGLPFQLVVLKHQNYLPAFKSLIWNLKEFILRSQTSVKPKISTWRKKEPSRTVAEEKLPTLSIIFPTLNGRHLVSQLLNSIKKQTYPKNKIEVIMVDNGSSDGVAELVKKAYPWVKLIVLPHNTGSAPPLTMASKVAKGDFILATNDDVVFEKNCLYELIKLALADGRVGIVTGKMMTLKSPHRPLYFGFRMNPYLGYHPFDYSGTRKVRECEWAPGACLLIAKKLLQKVGYFDDKYIFCGDDYDLCFQVRVLGYKIMYAPKAVYFHAFSRAQRQGKTSQENLFAHYRGKIRFMIKNASFLQIFTFFPVQFIFGPFYAYYKFGHKIFFPLFMALIWNLNHLEETIRARQEAKMRRNYYWQLG